MEQAKLLLNSNKKNFDDWCKDLKSKTAYTRMHNKICKEIKNITDIKSNNFIKTRSALTTQNNNIVTLVVNDNNAIETVLFCKREDYFFPCIDCGVFQSDVLYKTNNKDLFYHGYESFKSKNEQEQKEFDLIMNL